MKLSPKTYAKVLVELMIEKKADKKVLDPVKSAKGGVALEEQQFNWVNNFLKLLVKNGDMKKAKEIITLTEKLYFQKLGKRKVTLETARKIKDDKITKGFLKSSDVVNEVIKEDLIAGMRIIINDEKQLDFSLKNILEETFKSDIL